MRQGMIFTGLGIAMWAVATLFFLLFGNWVVLEVGDTYFGSSLFLLEMLSFLLLIGMALVVRIKLIPERGSATRFGFISAAIGLILNTFIIWYRDSVFTDFSEGQHHAFTIWMTLASALTLIVPAVVDLLVKDPEQAGSSERETGLAVDTKRDLDQAEPAAAEPQEALVNQSIDKGDSSRVNID